MRVKTQRRRGAAAVLAALALGLAACAPPPQIEVDVPTQIEAKLPAETAQELEDAVTYAMAAAGASGAIVGVWAPWSGQWIAGLGTQRVDGGAAVTPDLPFRAGRITRAMTCDALYVLDDQGVVSLDDSVTDYVSGVVDLKDVTLAQLCAGTSGIGAYSARLLPSWLAVPDRVWPARELASYGLGQPRVSDPGIAYRDSDAGYLLLGIALEKATGQTASEVLEEHVFAPLGLADTLLPVSPTQEVDGLLEGYHGVRDADGAMNCTEPLRVTDMSASFGFSDSGVVTDIDDLGQYVRALAAGALTPEGSERFDNPAPVGSRSPSWYTTTGGVIQAGSLVGQFGSLPGYATAAFADADSGLTVAVVLNNSAAGATSARNLAWELAAIASKAPAAQGETMPEAGLPWTAEQYREATTTAAVCPLPTPEEALPEE